MVTENGHLKEEVGRLKRIVETRRPVVNKLASSARNNALRHKRQLTAAVRRIDYLVEERDSAVKKCKELEKYVVKLEMKALKGGRGHQHNTNSGHRNQGEAGESKRVNASLLQPSFSFSGRNLVDKRAATNVSVSRADIMSNNNSVLDKDRVAKSYSAASELSKKGCQAMLQRDSEAGGQRSGNNVAEGRRIMELAKKPKKGGLGTLAASPSGLRSNRGRSQIKEGNEERTRSCSPAALEETLLASIIMDKEGVDALGLGEATERLQRDFHSFYDDKDANRSDSRVPLPAERE